MSKTIANSLCRKRLALLWFTVGGALLVLLVLQSVLGKYGSNADEAWAWFLPTIMPTLSLIIGVLVLYATSGDQPGKTVDRFLFLLAFGISALYLLLVALTILVEPLTGKPPLALMKLSNLWLGPLQGLVAAALGAFFVKGEQGG